VSEGLLETRPGIGTVVAVLPDSSRQERTHLLGHEIEELVVEAKRLGIGREEMLSSISDHWQRLTDDDPSRVIEDRQDWPNQPKLEPTPTPEDGGNQKL
jgi:GntR family transcriptional regulator